MRKVLIIPIVFLLSTSSVIAGKLLHCKPTEHSCKACGPDEESITDSSSSGYRECSFEPFTISAIAPDAFYDKIINKLVFAPKFGDPCRPHIINVEPESFRNLPFLDTLEFRFVELRGTPSPFKFLKSLANLRLNSNGLTELPGELFTGTSNLERLEVSGQDLTTLSSDSFSKINKELKDLTLSQNNLTFIEPRAFARLRNLGSLMLSDNRITVLRRDTLFGLGQLTILLLKNNNMSDVEPGALAGLNKLEFLVLGSNNLSNLRSDMFDGLDRLRLLELSGNEITIVRRDIFHGLSRLNWLELSDNKIREIDPAAFDGLINLQRLNLRSNRLKTLPDGFARNMNKLVAFDLRRNLISNVPVNFSQALDSLSWLAFSLGEKLEIEPRAFDKLQLDRFDLEGDQCNVPEADAFNGLSTKELDLYCNNIKDMKPHVFRGLKVERITICGEGNTKFDGHRQDLDDSVEIHFSNSCNSNSFY